MCTTISAICAAGILNTPIIRLPYYISRCLRVEHSGRNIDSCFKQPTDKTPVEGTPTPPRTIYAYMEYASLQQKYVHTPTL